MTAIKHRTVETNGIRMHVAEQGEGPLVVLCHGFPESWYSWRHQLAALAEAGFRAVAPDMRGYGQTDAPTEIESYTQLHLVGDMVGLLDALGVQTAVIVGHDWGGPVAWNSALLRPDRFRAVVGLSVPFIPRRPGRPSTAYPQTDDAIFYQAYFQTPGVAEKELERDVRSTIRRTLYSASGDAARRRELTLGSERLVGMVPRKGGFLDRTIDPETLPPPGVDVTIPGHLALELPERAIHRAAGDHLPQGAVYRLLLGLRAAHLHGALDEAVIENDRRATHERPPAAYRLFRNSMIAALTSRGRSCCVQWPQPGSMIVRRRFGTSLARLGMS